MIMNIPVERMSMAENGEINPILILVAIAIVAVAVIAAYMILIPPLMGG